MLIRFSPLGLASLLGAILFSFASSGAKADRLSAVGEFDHPTDVVVEATGTLLVLDAGNHRIQRLTPDGEPLAMWELSNFQPGPSCLALDEDGRVYVADHPGGSHRVQRFSSDGHLLQTWTVPRDRNGLLTGVALLDKQAHVYIGDRDTQRLEEYAPDGQLVAAWEPWPAWAANWYSRPGTCVARDMAGHVLVTESPERGQRGGWSLEQYDADGALVQSWTGYDDGSRFSGPVSFTTDPQGNWWIADCICFEATRPHRIVELAPDGTQLTEWPLLEVPLAGGFPAGLAWDAGTLWIVVSARSVLQNRGADGTLLRELGTPSGASPR